MAKTDIATPAETSASRPRDIFLAMRDEMDRMFERFEHGFPRWPSLLRQNHDTGRWCRSSTFGKTPTLSRSRRSSPGVEEKDVSVILTNGILTIKGGEEAE